MTSPSPAVSPAAVAPNDDGELPLWECATCHGDRSPPNGKIRKCARCRDRPYSVSGRHTSSGPCPRVHLADSAASLSTERDVPDQRLVSSQLHARAKDALHPARASALSGPISARDLNPLSHFSRFTSCQWWFTDSISALDDQQEGPPTLLLRATGPAARLLVDGRRKG